MFIICKVCNGDNIIEKDTLYCKYCGNNLMKFKDNGYSTIWIYFILSLFSYILANSYYIMLIDQSFGKYPSTIISGIVDLYREGSILVPTVIFLASVFIPGFKLLSIFLLLITKNNTNIKYSYKKTIYSLINFLGRWSMIDIFVIAILSTLVSFEGVLTILPGKGSLFFLLTLILNIIAVKRLNLGLIKNNYTERDKYYV